MEKKKRFNIKYYDKKKGYVIYFEGHDNKVYMDCFFPTWEENEQVDGVSVGIINRIKYLYDLGYVYDNWFDYDLDLLF